MTAPRRGPSARPRRWVEARGGVSLTLRTVGSARRGAAGRNDSRTPQRTARCGEGGVGVDAQADQALFQGPAHAVGMKSQRRWWVAGTAKPWAQSSPAPAVPRSAYLTEPAVRPPTR